MIEWDHLLSFETLCYVLVYVVAAWGTFVSSEPLIIHMDATYVFCIYDLLF